MTPFSYESQIESDVVCRLDVVVISVVVWYEQTKFHVTPKTR